VTSCRRNEIYRGVFRHGKQGINIRASKSTIGGDTLLTELEENPKGDQKKVRDVYAKFDF